MTKEISIGDYVLSGGELAAAVTCRCHYSFNSRAIGDESSALTDSFQDGLLAPPVYTLDQRVSMAMDVPEVLLSGHDRNID